MKPAQSKSKLVQDLKAITGDKYILTAEWSKQSYCKGWRYGSGEAFAVAKPRTLLEIWKILQICVDADIIIIMHFKLFFRYLSPKTKCCARKSGCGRKPARRFFLFFL